MNSTADVRIHSVTLVDGGTVRCEYFITIPSSKSEPPPPRFVTTKGVIQFGPDEELETLVEETLEKIEMLLGRYLLGEEKYNKSVEGITLSGIPIKDNN